MGMQLSHGRSWWRLGAAMAFSLLASACSDDDGTISTADANTMTQALEIKVGSNPVSKLIGELPQGSNQPGEPLAELDDNEIEARAGTTVDVDLVFTTGTGVELTKIFAKIGDASQYYEIAVSGGAKRAVRGKAGVSYPVSIVIPPFIDPGVFTILFSGQNAQGLNSNAVQLLINLAAAVAPTSTPAPSATPAPTATATPSASPTAAPTATPTGNPTASPTPAPTASASPTPSPTTSPNPTPSPTPGAGGKATACFDADLTAIGTRIEQVTLSTDGESGIDLTTTSDSVVMRTTTFKGNSATETESTVQARSQQFPTANSDSTTFSYTRLDGTTVKLFGVATDSQAGGFTITTTISNDPAAEDRFDLEPGQSYTQSYTTTSEVDTGFPVPGGAVPPTSITRKRTYVGQESVTVPAGTFNACKFTDEITSTTSGVTSNSSSTTWIAVGSGQFLKSVSDGDTNELISASINGEPVTGN